MRVWACASCSLSKVAYLAHVRTFGASRSVPLAPQGCTAPARREEIGRFPRTTRKNIHIYGYTRASRRISPPSLTTFRDTNRPPSPAAGFRGDNMFHAMFSRSNALVLRVALVVSAVVSVAVTLPRRGQAEPKLCGEWCAPPTAEDTPCKIDEKEMACEGCSLSLECSPPSSPPTLPLSHTHDPP